MNQTSEQHCLWCAVPMTPKTIFGKNVHECPKCKHRVHEEKRPLEPDEPSASVSAAR